MGMYVLTELGKDVAKNIEKDSKKPEKEIIEEVKVFLNSLTKDELLLFVYTSYPDMIEDAVEWKRLQPKRKEIGVGLYKKEKVSMGKAAEIAGMSASDMVRLLQKEGIYRVEEE